MSKDRDIFIAEGTKAGLSMYQMHGLLRVAKTIERLAEAQCNGDFPADNGRRHVEECQCGQRWCPSVFKGKPNLCPDCRATLKAEALVKDSGLIAECSGDPRGYTLKLYPANSTRQQRDSGAARYIGVPTGR